MAWYDWVLWAGIAYMFLGTDFTLNWLAGGAFGLRIHRRSKNPFQTIYYYVWARDDPAVRGDKVLGTPSVMAPWITSLCVINAVFTSMVELFLLYGMLQSPRPAWIFVPALLFPARAVIEMIYGSQIIWGPARIRGGALTNYLIIGLVPQVLVPCLVAWRFSGIGAGWIGGLLFVGTPLVIMLWTWAVYRRNPVPAFADRSGAG